MRAFTTPVLLALAALSSPVAVLAQAPEGEPQALVRSPTDRIERVTHEDALSRVDELRVGGQTQRIEVQPKTGTPGYQIGTRQGPADQGAAQGSGSAGRSSWRLLKF
ncbi:MAG: hypothetical protein EP308_04115 [Burkholderiales bacterium]|nr:MAG: hypothetical protein EP308_04115 [Burkholderiales bacterium]